ncbi:thiamine pyrophosphate-dependent dehydrogenase E1 component subunit alpha [Azospirillum sp. TSA2s]|uniref:thiamine pyrophosphate-dependent dehydrogenase E1 component subunit alpha n=1 Tax=Azospirillum sp. TSA2s TaxID=709810 RepID=UPI0010AAEEFD|nr:thiamine pyrophosphate-dependent dehydrogenase E1 component subunit alpha [Azospirillum sp. TSA2s]QCG95655.1 thiamine pyrophosphate-dependent dehydrogenase E1 component subunit alpha [Azospirillum sp. TSA2s]
MTIRPLDPVQALERMMLIRAYEETLIDLHGRGRAAGTCTSVGQEAPAVGVVSALTADDLILTNHRSAGHLLARGADPGRMLAEVMGKQDGYCGGKSGSLHISAKELGVVLTSTIVGGELALATGVGLSRTMLSKPGLNQPGIVACFFGDGAATEGRFQESLNLAAVWKLPILYVCENNQWQAFVHRKETMLADGISGQAAALGVESAVVDGNDPLAVFDAASSAIDTIRRTGKPFLLEAMTYRLRGHFEPDDQGYVDKAELAHWRDRDPILCLRARLEREGRLTADGVAAIEARVRAAMEAATAFADASPYPGLDALTTDVYA